MAILHLHHFAENVGTHCVALNPNQEDCEDKYLHQLFTHSVTFFRIRRNKKSSFYVQSRNSCLMIDIYNLVLNVINLRE